MTVEKVTSAVSKASVIPSPRITRSKKAESTKKEISAFEPIVESKSQPEPTSKTDDLTGSDILDQNSEDEFVSSYPSRKRSKKTNEKRKKK